jgi:hypothetical protein
MSRPAAFSARALDEMGWVWLGLMRSSRSAVRLPARIPGLLARAADPTAARDRAAIADGAGQRWSG